MKELKNIDAELIVVGALINNGDNYFKVGELVSDDFSEKFLGGVFDYLVERLEKGLETTIEHLKMKFPDDINILINASVTAIDVINIYAYASMVKELSIKRRFFEKVTDITKAFSYETDVDLAVQELNEIVTNEREISNIRDIQEVGFEILKSLDEEANCYQTGLARLDGLMGGGMYASKFYCIGAKEKTGKTITLGTISRNLSKAGVNHLFLALEMGCKEIMQRNIAAEAGTNSICFYNNKRKDESFKKKIYQAVSNQNMAGKAVDAPSAELNKLVTLIISSVRKYKLKGVILDYMQLVSGKMRGESESDFQNRVAQKLAEVCKKEDIFILTAAQLNREGQLYGSNGIKKAVDQLYFLHACENIPEGRYMTCEASRYTVAENAGDEMNPAFFINKKGPVLEDYAERI